MIFTQFCTETERFLKFCYISPVFDSQTKSLHNTYCRLCLCCQRDRSRPRIINLTLLTLRIKERDERNLIKIESVAADEHVSGSLCKLEPSLSFCRGSRVEGSMSRARVPSRGSRVTFFFSKFFFGKGNNRCNQCH